jgi:nucleotidyltransferase/DNA polymerase involved in DNA repair
MRGSSDRYDCKAQNSVARFLHAKRQISLSQPFAEDSIIYQSAVQLFKQIWANGRPVRLIGIGVSRLQEGYRQLSL